MKFLLLAVLAVFISACVAPQIENTKQFDESMLKLAAESSLSVEQACQLAAQSLQAGKQNQLSYFSPLHMQQAIDNFEDAQDQLKQPDALNKKHALINCLKTSQLIKYGNKVKQTVNTSLQSSFKQLDKLKSVDVKSKFSDDIQDYRNDLKEVITIIEAGKMADALNAQDDLINDMIEFEIEIIISRYIPAIKNMLDKAEDADAEKFAVQTYEKAETEIESAIAFIKLNYLKDKQVVAAANKAMLAAKHALYVAEEAKKLEGMKPELAEQFILYIESLFDRIGQDMGQKPVYGQSLNDQSSALALAAKKMKSKEQQ